MRAALKWEAKKRMMAQYGPCVGVQVVSMLIPVALSWITGRAMDIEAVMERAMADPEGNAGALLGYFLLALLISVFTATISTEVSYFYLRVFRGEGVRVGGFISGLLVDVGRKAGAYLWMMLFLFLWAGLAMIPLIIVLIGGAHEWIYWIFMCASGVLIAVKALSYSLMPYIIRDCPEVSVRKSMRVSIALMKGHKGKLFVLELSFLGWMLLSAATFGVLHMLYVGPYMAIALAGFYHNRKGENPQEV